MNTRSRWIAGCVGALLAASGWATPAQANGALSLEQLQSALKSHHAGWIAGNTSVSALPHEVVTRMLGVPLSLVRKPHFLVKEGPRALLRVTKAAPATFDWRNVNGTSFVSPILDQGQCGSCVAFATIGTLETQLNISSNTTTSPWQLSPEYLFECGGGSCDWGWEPDSAMQFLVDTGTTDDACLPYTSGANGTDAECSAACTDASSRAVKIESYTTPSSGGNSIDAVKAALQKGPLEATMTVYDDFMYYKSGVYKHVTGGVAGGHAVSIIGWNDADQAWIVRNSWGTQWGENGFFEIAYSDNDSGVGQDTWGIVVTPPGPYVAIGLRDHTVLNGTETVPFTSQGIAGAQLSWTLANGSTQVASGDASDGNVGAFDTTTVPDGVYTLTPHAAGGANPLVGEPRIVYVLNGTETGKVTMKGLSNGQKLSGTETLQFNTAADPVPLTEVTFTLTDADGNPKLARATVDTGDVMQIGWDTTDVPNGTYTLTIGGLAGSQAITPAVTTVSVSN